MAYFKTGFGGWRGGGGRRWGGSRKSMWFCCFSVTLQNKWAREEGMGGGKQNHTNNVPLYFEQLRPAVPSKRDPLYLFWKPLGPRTSRQVRHSLKHT